VSSLGTSKKSNEIFSPNTRRGRWLKEFKGVWMIMLSRHQKHADNQKPTLTLHDKTPTAWNELKHENCASAQLGQTSPYNVGSQPGNSTALR